MPKISTGRYLTDEEIAEIENYKRLGKVTNFEIGMQKPIQKSCSWISGVLRKEIKAEEGLISRMKKFVSECAKETRKRRN